MNIEMPVIKRSRFILRDINVLDYLDYFDYGKDEITTRYVTWGPLRSPLEALWSIENVFLKRPLNDTPVGYAIVDPKVGKMIGHVDFHTIYWNINCAEMGFMLHRDYWNMGLMTSVVKEMIILGFEYLKLNKILIGHVRENIGSQHVIKKCGLSYEFIKKGAFVDKEDNSLHDILYYSIYKNEFESRYLR